MKQLSQTLALLLLSAQAFATSFSVAPSVTGTTTGAYTVGQTLTGSGTVYLVACKKDTTAPTAAQVKAGQCTGSVSAEASANKATTGADSETLGSVLPFPIYDVYVVGTVAGVDSSLNSLLAQMLTATAGKQNVLLTSVSATSWCHDFNAISGTAIATGDVVQVGLLTSPSSDSWTQQPDCNGNYMGDSSRQSLGVDVYDASAGAFMGSPNTLWFNDIGPTCSGPAKVFAVQVNTVMTAIDLNNFCSNPQGDTLSYAVTTGSLPTGVALSGTGNKLLSGTPTVASPSGVSFTITATDVAGKTTLLAFTVYPLSSVTVPDCITIPSSAGACSAQINAQFLTAFAGFSCSPSVAINNVISETPAAGTVVQPFTVVTMLVSSGLCQNTFKHFGFKLKLGL